MFKSIPAQRSQKYSSLGQPTEGGGGGKPAIALPHKSWIFGKVKTEKEGGIKNYNTKN
jgi:hypothetical protein